MTDKFIPRILLCGDMKNFLRALDGQKVNIVGQIDCDGGKIFSDNAQLHDDDAQKIFYGADYVIFDDSAKFATNFERLARFGSEKFLTRESFLKFAGDNFFALENAQTLLDLIRQLKFSRLLDADDFFARNEIFSAFAHGLEVDGIDENFSARRFPLLENFYNKIYPTFDACKLQTYDAIILSADRSVDEIFDALVATDAVTEKILLFVRKNSAHEDWLAESSVAFSSVENFPAVNGSWALLTKFAPTEDFGVCSANDLPVDTKGAVGNLRRYLGDDIASLHWLWKNTKHTTIGLVNGDSPSQDEISEILRGCDVIVAPGEFSALTPHEQTISLCGEYLNEHVEKIFRKHLKLKQPNYLSAFHFVSEGHCLFPFGKFITRRNIFDSYCSWLFSFVTDVAREVLDTTNISAVENPKKYRVVALISERLLTVWLAKNRLRLVPAL